MEILSKCRMILATLAESISGGRRLPSCEESTGTKDVDSLPPVSARSEIDDWIECCNKGNAISRDVRAGRIASEFKNKRKYGGEINDVLLTNPSLIGVRWAVYRPSTQMAIGTISRSVARELAASTEFPVVRVLRVNHKKGTCTISAKV